MAEQKVKIPDTGVLPVKRRDRTKELWQCSILTHGMPKIGKTKFAADFPAPCFAATEEGQGFVDIYEPVPIFDEIVRKQIGPNEFSEEFVGVSGWEKFNTLIHDLAHREHGFQTLVVDTVDNLWLRCVKWWTVHHGVEYELDGSLSYGKGTSLIARDFTDTLTRACRLPLGVVFISHSMEKEFVVDGTKKKKTRVITTLPQRAMQIINSMVDIIVYITFEGSKRVIRTKAGPNYDAGSRIPGLPETIDFSYDAFVEAYINATNGANENAKVTLIERIHKGEHVLATSKIDDFNVDKRRDNSRQKHAGNKNLEKCNLGKLEQYLQHLQVKYQKGNGNASA